MVKALITGSSGFIGHHLKNFLGEKSLEELRESDILNGPEEDLRIYENAKRLTKGIDEVYHLAADVGGIGYLSDKESSNQIFLNNSLINLNLIRACLENNVKKLLFASSACVYSGGIRKEVDAKLEETENLYGYEKLNTEKLFSLFSDKLDIKIIRFQNIYGPECKLVNGMAIADICGKVIESNEELEIWGNGTQLRNWVYVMDCIGFIDLVMKDKFTGIVNLGVDEPVSIKELAEKLNKISKKTLKLTYDLSKPTGTMIKSSDNSLRKEIFPFWSPSINIDVGLSNVYNWMISIKR